MHSHSDLLSFTKNKKEHSELLTELERFKEFDKIDAESLTADSSNVTILNLLRDKMEYSKKILQS